MTMIMNVPRMSEKAPNNDLQCPLDFKLACDEFNAIIKVI